jgi:leucyl aminopeptidase (aminopeptidase T)
MSGSDRSDVGGFRPEILRVIHVIYQEMAHMQAGDEVLVIADSRTAPDVVNAFFGEALAMGATAQVLQVPTPPPPSIQTSIVWSKTVHAATTTPDLIVDLSIGYADFIVDAVKRGARVLCPGDGTGHDHLIETLLRTVGAVDLHALRKEADRLAELFTAANTVRITSEEGTDLTIDAAGLRADPNDGFLWDPDKEDWKASWALLPPAQPGLLIPTGRTNGTLAVDGFILYEPSYDHETPLTPLLLHVKDGWIEGIEGNPLTSNRLRGWLDSWAPDHTPYHGPVHCNVGINPRAMLTQHQEFERLRGTITFGWGDNSALFSLMHSDEPTVTSPVHWDCMILRPTLQLDDRVVIERGVMPPLEGSGRTAADPSPRPRT